MEAEPSPLSPPPAVELVVARYEEDMSWTGNIPPSILCTIYNKGDDLQGEEREAQKMEGEIVERGWISLPNEGREAHTYLHHLIERYDSLAPLTIFCQGRPFDHFKHFHRLLRGLHSGSLRVEGFQWLGFILDTDDPGGQRLFTRWSKNEDGRGLALGEFYRQLFGEPGPEAYRFFVGAQFVVSREVVRRRPLEFYRRALELCLSFPDAEHCFERTWNRVFGEPEISPAVLGGEKTRFFREDTIPDLSLP